jgi:peptidoglycan/LPS O-acetylase OafA/YrhL
VGAFYARRALRIWPLYFVALALLWTCEPMLLHLRGMGLGELAAYAGFVGNWWIVIHGAKAAATTGVVLWSVSIEEQFYLAWPLVARRCTPRGMMLLCLLLMAVSAAVRVYLAAIGAVHDTFYFNSFVRLDNIALGSMLAVGWAAGRWRVPDGWRRPLMIGACLAIWAASRLKLGVESSWTGIVTYPIWAIACTCIVAAVLRDRSADETYHDTLLVRLGKISYGLYVWHYACIRWVDVQLPGASALMQAPVSLAVTIAVSTLSWMLLERPFLRLKERFAVVPSRPV